MVRNHPQASSHIPDDHVWPDQVLSWRRAESGLSLTLSISSFSSCSCRLTTLRSYCSSGVSGVPGSPGDPNESGLPTAMPMDIHLHKHHPFEVEDPT
ncbi:unnamed protein product [Arctogadus glacialis]